MEEKDTGERDPVDLHCAEQTDLVSLIISGEEEATQEESDLGHCSLLGDEDDEDDDSGGGLANGHDEDESRSSMATPASSPHTSYWSVTEGPDQPLLLSPAPGPSGGGKAPRVPRASRQGLSRIPGRDHRRYYHEYWRSEYLMDFDQLRQGMICMVCGSSLATLKLSTIKRHIRQKHPDSLLWSPGDKEVIRSGWESHLGLGGAQKPFFPPEEDGGGGGGGGGEGAGAGVPLDPLGPLGALGALGALVPLDPGLEELFAQDPPPAAESSATAADTGYIDPTPQPLQHPPPQQQQQQQQPPLGPPPYTGPSGQGPQPSSDEDEEEEEEPVERRREVPMKVEPMMMTTTTMTTMTGHATTAMMAPAGGGEEPSARTLERYLNDSLHAWFRQEFLMEYEAPAAGTGVSRLLCMVCGGQPHSLHLDHIKGHVLERHPDSLVYSAEEKHRVLQAWAHAHPEEEAGPFIKSERDTKDPEAGLFPQDAGYLQGGYALPPGHAPLTQDPGGIGGGGGGGLIGEDGIGGFGGAVAGTPDHRGPRGRGAPRRRRLRGGEPWRLRLDYLVAYGPQGRGTYCMVCSQALAETKVSGFRRHIQECHPETGGLGRKEREAMAAAWTKDYHGDHVKEELHPSELVAATATDGAAAVAAAAAGDWPSPLAGGGGHRRRRRRAIKKEGGGRPGEEEEEQQLEQLGGAPPPPPGSCSSSSAGAASSRHTHYPGKDQRRNYQVRWRLDFLMDYDCRRHGLICMVCGSTLATLKVSTIKRHIQQVHPRSLAYDAGERQRALLSYGRTAARFVHADDCFATQDHGHGGPGAAAPATPTGHSGT